MTMVTPTGTSTSAVHLPPSPAEQAPEVYETLHAIGDWVAQHPPPVLRRAIEDPASVRAPVPLEDFCTHLFAMIRAYGSPFTDGMLNALLSRDVEYGRIIGLYGHPDLSDAQFNLLFSVAYEEVDRDQEAPAGPSFSALTTLGQIVAIGAWRDALRDTRALRGAITLLSEHAEGPGRTDRPEGRPVLWWAGAGEDLKAIRRAGDPNRAVRDLIRTRDPEPGIEDTGLDVLAGHPLQPLSRIEELQESWSRPLLARGLVTRIEEFRQQWLADRPITVAFCTEHADRMHDLPVTLLHTTRPDVLREALATIREETPFPVHEALISGRVDPEVLAKALGPDGIVSALEHEDARVRERGRAMVEHVPDVPLNEGASRGSSGP